MASIQERKNKDGKSSFICHIRTKGLDIKKTFYDKKDAEIFASYKERLITNMSNFEIDIKDRIRLIDVIDTKIKAYQDRRSIAEFENAYSRAIANLKPHTFLSDLTYDDWLQCCKEISSLMIPRRHGSPEMINISPLSIRRIFASLSSAFSSAIAKGIQIENYPLQVIQRYINPALKKKSDCD
jgi:hypothetical protein